MTEEEKRKVFHDIVTARQTGIISCMIAERLGIEPYEAFRRFIRSYTYAQFRKPFEFYSTLGESTLANLFLQEQEL